MMKWLLILTTAISFTACTKKGSSIEDGFLAGVSISAGASTIEIAASTIISGNSTTVTLTTRDSEGNIFHVPGSSPDVQFKTSGGTSTGIFSSVTNHGDGTYTATFSGAVAGSQTVIGATIDGQELTSTTAKVTVLPANYSAANSYVTLSASTVASRSTITATFYAMDASNTQLPGGGLTVSFNIASGTSTGTFATTTDNGDGSYTAVFTGKLVGTAASISASVASIAITSSLPTVTVTPGTAAAIAVNSGNTQSAVVNNALASSLKVKVTDAEGNVVPSAQVDWTTTGTSSLGSASDTTDSSGISTNTLTVGTVTGNYTVTAKIHGTTTTTTFTATATPGAINNFLLSSVPTSATAGTSFTTTVTARDSYNNVKTDYTGAIQFSSSDPNSPTLPSNYTFVSGDAGVKQFNFTLKTTGNQTLTATQVSGGAPTVTSSNISVSPATIYQLIYIADPTNTVAGSTISTVTVRAVDAYANTVSSFTGNITLAIGTNAGSGTLSGTKVVAATSGTADFTDLSIEKSGTGYTLSATATGVSAKVSNAFNITPDVPASIAVSSGNNQSGTISTALGSSMVAVVKDTYGNNVPNVTVNWTTSAGALGSASSTSNSSGLASNTLTLSSTTGTHTVTATVASTAYSTSFTETATNGPASQLSFSTQPVGNVTPGTTLSTQPVVRILDASGNLVTTGADATATVSVALTTGTGALGGTTSLSAVGGIATFTNVNATVYGTGKVMTATKSGTIMSGGVGSLTQTSNSFDITQASPTSFTISSITVSEAGKLRVTWGSSTNANSYTVKYGTSAGNYSTTASTSATSPYDITGLTGGTTYYIMVTAVNTATSVDATSAAMGIPMDAFTLTSLTPGVGSSSLAFASAAGATTYDVLYDTSSHTASQTYANTTTSVTSPATTSSLSTGTTYYYRVRANNSYGSIVSTNELSGAVYQTFTLNIPFTAGTESSYSISNSTSSSLSSGYALLNKTPLTDSVSSNFSSGTMTSVQWDSTKSALRLNASANTNTLDNSWTPAWSNLVAYYKLDGNLTDALGNYNGASTGTVTYTTGKLGQAAVISSGNYVTITNAPNFTSSWSIATWVYMTGSSSERPFVSYGTTTSANTGFYFGYDGNNYGTIYVNDGTTTISPYPYGSTDNSRWTHILVTYDSSTKRKTMYRNGILANSSTSSANISTSGGTMYIGRGISGSSFTGYIDEVAVWNTTLSATQAATLYAAQSGTYSGKFSSRIMDAQAYGSTDTSWTSLTFKTTSPFGKEISEATESSTSYPSISTSLNTSLKALWHFNEASYNGTSGEVKDSSGNSFNGTRGGTTTTSTTRTKFNNGAYFNNCNPAASCSNVTYNDYVTLPASSNFIATDNQPITVSAWIFAHAIGTTGSTTIDNHLITFHRGSPSETLTLGLGNSGKLMVYSYNDGSAVYQSSTTAINRYLWTHVALTFNGTCIQLYINGEADGSCVNAKVNAGNSYATYLGNTDGTANGRYRGYIDEMGVWSRSLSATEMRDLYRRSTNRIRYQVRSCAQADCSDQSAVSGLGWKGPDNSVDTYFSENYNKASNSVTGAILGTSASMTFANFAGFSVTANRYFQYRAFFESDDTSTNCTYNSTAAACSPELQSVVVGADRYDSTAPTYTATGSGVIAVFQTLDANGFTETLGSNGCSAGAKYALSADGSTFYYYDGSAWASSSDYSTASTAAQINAGMSTFAATAGAGTLRVKSFLKSSNSTQCEIDNLQITGKKY